MVAHGQIILNQFQNYPGRAAPCSAIDCCRSTAAGTRAAAARLLLRVFALGALPTCAVQQVCRQLIK